jgi:hypothetical protein
MPRLHFATMRRWFAIFLLVLLPFPSSWAAVASYCAHETEAGAPHLGHHEHSGHSHDTWSAADADQTDSEPAAADLDCGHCHGCCVGIVQRVPGKNALTRGNLPPALSHGPRASHLPPAPERPQWSRLA